MPRYLLHQWTGDTIRAEDREYGSHGSELWATPSSSSRLLEVVENDVVIIAGVVDGRLLPIAGLRVRRTVSRDQLVAEGRDPYDLPYFAEGKPPSPRMNLRHPADRGLSLAIRKEDGTLLARRKVDSEALDGQGFRYPQWLNEDSAKCLLVFLDELWRREDDEGLDDPVRISRGLAPRMTSSERRVIELHAMEIVARVYRREGFEIADVSASEPWDLTATHLVVSVGVIAIDGTKLKARGRSSSRRRSPSTRRTSGIWSQCSTRPSPNCADRASLSSQARCSLMPATGIPVRSSRSPSAGSTC